MGDILLALPLMLLALGVGAIAALPFVDLDELEAAADGAVNDSVLIMTATTLIALQTGQFLWPVIVARWKGFGFVRDFRFQFKLIDLAIGFGTAVAVLVVAGVMSEAVSSLVGLDSGADESSNTQILSDAEGSPYLWIVLGAAVLGAPIVEELFFRGLCLRAIEKRWGTVAGVVGSSVIFTVPHWTGSTLEGTIVLFSVIGSVGLILGVVAVKVGRLGPAIVAHLLFNLVGSIAALTA